MRGIPVWQVVAVGVIALDLMVAGWNFNPSADPAWLDYTPASIQWLQAKQAEGVPFRYTTINFGDNPLHANSTWRYGLHDARGYDSMIPKQYADYMSLIAPQGGLLNNRIDPVAWNNPAALASPLLDLLNVKYVVTDWVIPDDCSRWLVNDADELGYRRSLCRWRGANL